MTSSNDRATIWRSSARLATSPVASACTSALPDRRRLVRPDHDAPAGRVGRHLAQADYSCRRRPPRASRRTADQESIPSVVSLSRYASARLSRHARTNWPGVSGAGCPVAWANSAIFRSISPGVWNECVRRIDERPKRFRLAGQPRQLRVIELLPLPRQVAPRFLHQPQTRECSSKTVSCRTRPTRW